jgi:glycosyltransferase involved in cell wall biosynthesis
MENKSGEGGKNKKSICFINATNPNFLGGVSLYQKYLIDFLDKKKFDITWIYKGDINRKYKKEGINYIEIKVPFKPTRLSLIIREIIFNKKVKRYLENNYFDIINTHAVSGYWLKNYKKKKNQKIIHTYHGLTIPYYKVQLKMLGFLKRIIFSCFLLPYAYFIEKPPIKKADKIICVSEKVKKQVERVYRKRKNIFAIRTGVDINKFKPKNKNKIRKDLGLRKDFIYGLYVGKGGYWIKGLDRAVKVSEEIYKKNKKFRLIVLGADITKRGIKNLIKKEFIIYKQEINREKIPHYYSASDLLFCLSRYDGGAPTLVVSEAMASGCLVICSQSSEQEIIKDGKNGLIIGNCDEGVSRKEIEKILNVLMDKNKKPEIVKESIKTIKDISLDKWGGKYLEVLTK